MAEVANTTKILALKKIFFGETDEEHKLSVAELIEKLQLSLATQNPIDKKRIKRYIDGSNAQLLSPPALVQQMKEEVEKMNDLYS